MNLEDVIDPEYGLQQDEWSLSKPRFGEDGQLEVVGWSGKNSGIKYYILKCSICSQDPELFGGGYFRNPKGAIMRGTISCGCSVTTYWDKKQYFIKCSRKAQSLGYTFLGFNGEWKAKNTRINISCEKHGIWNSGSIRGLLTQNAGCPDCKYDIVREAVRKNSDDFVVASFFTSGAFHPDTKFLRSGEVDSGRNAYWLVTCPECGEASKSIGQSLQKGHRPCACSKHRQQECYINWIVDDRENAVAIKFGIANNSKQRIKSQDRQSAYEVRQYQVYTFPDVASCKQAERECKKELETGVVLKRDMPDGYSETTWAYNVGKVKDIYERNGGVLV